MAGRLRSLEQRVATRIPIRMLVEYELMEDFLADYTANVSLGGMFIQTESPLEMGTRFRLRLRLPGKARPVETFGEVRFIVKKGTNSIPGMGIEFDPLSNTDRKSVEALLATWQPTSSNG